MRPTRDLAAFAALTPVAFVIVAAALTVAQAGFLRSIGWDPEIVSDVPFPSALALGPLGAVQMASFALAGLGVLALAGVLHLSMFGGAGRARLLLAGAGVAMIALASPTDPHLEGPLSPSGAVHLAAFVTFLVLMALAPLALGIRMRRDPSWRTWGTLSIAVGPAGAAAFALSSQLPSLAGSVVGLAVPILWLETTALRALARAQQAPAVARQGAAAAA